MVGHAINQTGPKVTLEGFNHQTSHGTVTPVRHQPVAIGRKRRLETPDIFAAVAVPQHAAARNRRFRPQTCASLGQTGPIEPLTRVPLTSGRHVGVAEDLPPGDAMAHANAVRQHLERLHLCLGIRRRTKLVARVGEFEPDRSTVDVGFATPACNTGMPGPPVFRNQLKNTAVFINQVVGADLRYGIAKAVERRLGGFHPRIVQYQHGDLATCRARTMIGRGTMGNFLCHSSFQRLAMANALKQTIGGSQKSPAGPDGARKTGSVGGNMPDVRNVAIVGPSLSGKTTLLESMLFVSGAIARKGTVKDGNTVGDSAPEARTRQMSTEVSGARAVFDGVTFNFLDCPGSIEIQAETRNALIGCDAAVVVYEPVIERAMTLAPTFKFLSDNGIPHIVFINKMDRTSTLMRDLIPAMQEVSDKPLLINQVPVRDGEHVTGYVDLVTEKSYSYKSGAASAETEMPDSVKTREQEARTMMLETLADFDDTLLEKLLEDELPSTEEIIADLHDTLGEGSLVPVLIGAAEQENGVRRLLQHLAEWTPNASTTAEHRAIDDGKPAAQVLKTFHTLHGGKLSLVRVWRGTIKDGETVNGERIGGIYHMMGAQQEKVDKADAGDIVTFGRLDEARTGDTLAIGSAGPSQADELPRAEALPRLYGLAIHADRRDDEVKLSAALQKIQDEDPSIVAENDQDINQLILWGQGDIHLNVAFEKLKNRYGIAVTAERSRIPYREAIRKPITQHGRFKRQTGGSGMFGDVHVNIKPLQRGAGFEFVNAITGGSVPRQYIPAVEAGVKEYMVRGPLGFPVVDVSVELFDGKYHDVDSNEMAFKLAARSAMNEGMPNCSPILLEPICEVHIHNPNNATSKVQQLVTGRRGQLLGFEVRDGWKGWDTVTAHMPQAEILDLIAELRSLSQGVAWFSATYDHLQELSGRVADQVVENRKDQLEAA